jgi:hypothetical protein
MGKYRHIKGHYAIVIDGHTTFPEDVILKFKRLDYLEKLLKKESDLKQEMLAMIKQNCIRCDFRDVALTNSNCCNGCETYKIIQKAKES